MSQLTYGNNGNMDRGQDIDTEFFEAHPYELYYFRNALPDELGKAGHPDYDGLMLVYKIDENTRIRKPVLDEEQGTQAALDLMDMLG